MALPSATNLVYIGWLFSVAPLFSHEAPVEAVTVATAVVASSVWEHQMLACLLLFRAYFSAGYDDLKIIP